MTYVYADVIGTIHAGEVIFDLDGDDRCTSEGSLKRNTSLRPTSFESRRALYPPGGADNAAFLRPM